MQINIIWLRQDKPSYYAFFRFSHKILQILLFLGYVIVINIMENNSIVNKIRQALQENCDEKTRKSNQYFFKEPVKLYGVKTDLIVKIGKAVFASLPEKKKTDIFKVCEELWQSGYLEEAGIACNWSYYVHKNYVPADLGVFENWIDSYVSNWATCDTLCNHSVGEFIEMYPEYLKKLKEWAKSKNRWMRRASAVSLIIPARKGKFLKDIIEIANILLLDKDDLVQKGYGWMLKVASQTHQQEIFDYVMEKKAIMPRTALRYAIEKMPPELRNKAMMK
jgi:3-methyladenine DNA glycosylase AlkD